ncbi:hypothetical protein V8F20_003913 [Naviculisporaceae sp. PSN 640]
MNYLFKHNKTRSYLATWAGGAKLLIAQYFFWRADSAQNRLKGLKIRLLYILLDKAPPHFAETLFPSHVRSEATATLQKDWRPERSLEDEHVSAAFGNLSDGHRNALAAYKLCFFIDGLDEFYDESGHEDYTDLVTTLQEWAHRSTGQIKICASSRELPEFTFSACQTVHLQDLTRPDIDSLPHHGGFAKWFRQGLGTAQIE